MSDLRARIDEVSGLMQEFGLDQAKLKGEDWEVEFSNLSPASSGPSVPQAPAAQAQSPAPAKPKVSRSKSDTPKGTPVTSPMTGIYYSSPSPGSPPFVKEGEMVTAGQVVALIEAMKVFNEVTALTGGLVQKVVATNGQLVQPGDVIFTLA